MPKADNCSSCASGMKDQSHDAVAPISGHCTASRSARQALGRRGQDRGIEQVWRDVADQGAASKFRLPTGGKTRRPSSNLKQPVKFNADLKLREGGQFAAQGSVVPASGELQADVRLSSSRWRPAAPSAHYLKLKIARGNVPRKGGSALARARPEPSLRYVGALNVAGLTLNEEDGGLFAAWKSASADKFTASLNPNRLDVPELRIVEPTPR